jgi:hypothetical protein
MSNNTNFENWRMKNKVRALAMLASIVALSLGANAANPVFEYRMLATSKTSTMEKELNEAAAEGYRFRRVMGGRGNNGGQVIVAMVKDPSAGQQALKYKLLATGKTSTMQAELQQLASQGYSFLDQTVFEGALGGREVVVIMELDTSKAPAATADYLLLATTKASTMEKELQEAGSQGYELMGFTVGNTGLGGSEIIATLRKAK